MTESEIKLLWLDYEKTLAFVDKMDGILFQIKGWAVIACSGIIAFGIAQNSVLILSTSFFAAGAFFFLELIYKSFHEDGIKKSFELEEWLKMALDPSFLWPAHYRFGIGHGIRTVRFKDMAAIMRSKGRWHLRAFYWLLVFATLISILIVNFLYPAC